MWNYGDIVDNFFSKLPQNTQIFETADISFMLEASTSSTIR